MEEKKIYAISLCKIGEITDCAIIKETQKTYIVERFGKYGTSKNTVNKATMESGDYKYALNYKEAQEIVKQLAKNKIEFCEKVIEERKNVIDRLLAVLQNLETKTITED